MPHAAAPPPPVSRARAVGAFLVAGLLVLAALAVLLTVVQHRAAVGSAVEQARALTVQQARSVVEPALTDAVLRPGPERDALGRALRERVLDRSVVRVKLWDQTGRILWSDEADLIDRTFVLGEQERAAFGPAYATQAGLSGLDEPEHLDERPYGRLLQVYVGVQTREGTPLLFETYQRYEPIAQASRRAWLAGLPVLLGALVALWLAQAPLAWRMAGRLRATQDARERLLVAALDCGDRERSRLAVDLHQGVVRDLVGASHTLTSAAGRAAQRADDPEARRLHDVASQLRRTAQALGSLVVTIQPPTGRSRGLLESVRDLVAPLQDRGLSVALDLDDRAARDLDADPRARELVVRAAQEVVCGVLRRHTARSVRIGLAQRDGRVRLQVDEDGGVPPVGPDGPDGTGLALLEALIEQAGGALDVTSLPDGGTRTALTLPLRGRAAGTGGGRERARLRV